jgi:hypothetical protein
VTSNNLFLYFAVLLLSAIGLLWLIPLAQEYYGLFFVVFFSLVLIPAVVIRRKNKTEEN